ncbi:MAG TPA: 4-alpha-glucanotransferase [Vicinamibacterales bacterium]|nr:4-alpha-glucanotransferase [Vicinamibacterales bacterium]
MTQPLLLQGRHGGVLVPLFSIPSRDSWGIGEIGDIPVFADWLRAGGQDLLQLLPINEMAVGQRSPYSAMTAMAIDPIFTSVRNVPEFQAIGGEPAMDAAWRGGLEEARRSAVLDYGLVRGLKEQALRAAFARFHQHEWQSGSGRAEAFTRWAADQAWWLDDYALFRALHAREEDRPWTEWPEALRDRDPAALAGATRELEGEILYRRWLQWIADTQWHVAKEAMRPVALLGDLPFMVDGDSADVWAHAGSFRLDACVGAPPDAFSKTGQNWGLPVYRWDRMAASDYPWLRARARRSASLYDGYRVDHLVGFYRTYVFPKDKEGKPFFTPKEEREQLRLGETVLRLFAEPGARIIAEDLGTVPNFVRESLARLQVPGYKVFRWEREWDESEQPFRDPAEYPAVSVAASGTHDTETVAAWWESLDEAEQAKVLDVPGLRALLNSSAASPGRFSPALRDALLELLVRSGSDLLLLPIQDVFGWRDRINVPASQGAHNWTWRLPWPVDTLQDVPEAQERARILAAWSRQHGRMETVEGRR